MMRMLNALNIAFLIFLHTCRSKRLFLMCSVNSLNCYNLKSSRWDKHVIWMVFVGFDSLHPSQQFFSYVGMHLPGLNQY